MARAAVDGFVPPPYPHDRLGDLHEIAAAAPGGLVDASVGTPVDPTPDFVLDAARNALDQATGYPASIGYPALREAAAGWLRRRFGVELGPDAVTACIGTKEAVAALQHNAGLRERLRMRIRHVIVDEYQDVNPVQATVMVKTR